MEARGFEEKEYFKFGAGPVIESTRAWLYPVGINKCNMVLKTYKVTGDCPVLISGEDMGEMNLGFHAGAQTMTVGGCEMPMEFTESGLREGSEL